MIKIQRSGKESALFTLCLYITHLLTSSVIDSALLCFTYTEKKEMKKSNPKDSLKVKNSTTSLQDLAKYLAKRQIGKDIKVSC